MRCIPVFLILLMALLTSALYATQPGKWGLAAQLFSSSGTEIALARMASASTMYLFNTSIAFDVNSSETENEAGKADGPKMTKYAFDLAPEIRTYMLPDEKVSPYIGFLVSVGLENQKDELTTGAGTLETNSSKLSAGLGLSFGAEYFMSKHFSVSAHTRLLSYRFIVSKTEAGTPTQTETRRMHSLLGSISPAIFIRLYF